MPALRKPYYVKKINLEKNKLIITPDKEKLAKKQVFLSPINFLLPEAPEKKLKVRVKTRYRQKLSSATLYLLKKNKARLVFDQPKQPTAPGQYAVFYKKNTCLGGGRILFYL